MNDLYNELIGPTIVHLEEGKIESNPPNSLQLRAARALKKYFDQTQVLGEATSQFQQQIAQLNDEITNLKAINASISRTNSETVVTN